MGTERYVHEFASGEAGVWLKQSHPHSLPLQIWINLGIYGAGLFCLGVYCLYQWIQKQSQRMQPALMAQMVSIIGVASVSHGAWQSWWLAVVPLPFLIAYLDLEEKNV